MTRHGNFFTLRMMGFNNGGGTQAIIIQGITHAIYWRRLRGGHQRKNLDNEITM